MIDCIQTAIANTVIVVGAITLLIFVAGVVGVIMNYIATHWGEGWALLFLFSCIIPFVFSVMLYDCLSQDNCPEGEDCNQGTEIVQEE